MGVLVSGPMYPPAALLQPKQRTISSSYSRESAANWSRVSTCLGWTGLGWEFTEAVHVGRLSVRSLLDAINVGGLGVYCRLCAVSILNKL